MKIEASTDFLNRFLTVLDDCVLNLPDHKALGPSYTHEDFVPHDLALHRVKSKYDLPGSYDEKSLHAKALQDFHTYDASLYGFRYTETDERQRSVLYRARLFCHKLMADFKVIDTDLDFSPGETFVSSQGKTSLYQKLNKLKNWTVTADAAEEFTYLVYRTRGLKRVAMRHIYRNASRSELKNTWKTVIADKRGIGYAVFAKLMSKHVLTIVLGSRMVTVYKNNRARRLINIEPWGNVILQRRRGLAIKRLLRSVGNDLTYGQEDHKVLISNPENVTVDLRNASNSTATRSVEFMLPVSKFNSFNRVRSEFVFDGTDWCRPNLFSAMGNGFTFELMTLILLSVARVLDPDARVYGDDIIIKSSVADEFIHAIKALGYGVNPEKTFIEGKFRESCGAFFHGDFGYLKSFDLKRPNDLIEAIICVNKMYVLKDIHPWFRSTYKKVQSLFPALHKGPPPFQTYDDCRKLLTTYDEKEFLSHYVWADTTGRTKHPAVRGVYNSIDKTFADRLSIPNFEVIQGFKYSLEEASVCQGNLHTLNLSKLYYYIWSGRRTKDIIRNSNQVKSKLLIFYDGRTVDYNSLKTQTS